MDITHTPTLHSKQNTHLPTLSLSLQIAKFADAPEHRKILARHHVHRWVRHALTTDAEITVRIVGQGEGRSLNKMYREKDYATNVLTFGYTQSPVITADLVLCGPVVAMEAKAAGLTLNAHYAHLLIHGTLHAQGWDHETSEENARAMESTEIQILSELGFANPYA